MIPAGWIAAGWIAAGWIAAGWVVRVAMVPVVARRHAPAQAMAWLAPIFLFPFPGTLFYLWLSRYGLARSARGHRRVHEAVETDDRLRQQRRHRVGETTSPGHRDLVRLAERMVTGRLGGFPVLGGNAVELLDGAGEMVERLVAEIEAAERHAHLLFYQFVDDATGRRVAEALARAAARGVACRVLCDGWASRSMRRTLGPWMEARGIRLHGALPIHPLRRPLARIDVRNHRKIAVVDGRVAFTGSDNVHDPGHALEEGVWHQLSARVEGPAALQLQMLFVEDWYFATEELLQGGDVFPDPEAAGSVPVQTVPGGPSYPSRILQHVLVQAIGEADERLVLTTPYLVPDEPLLLAIRLAALRGVDVRVLVPRRSDRRVADLAARAFFADLLDAGVRIHVHARGVVHLKTVSVDDALAVVGTANLDRRSLFLNYEDVLLLFDRGCAVRLREVQDRYLREAEPVDPDAWGRRPRRAQYAEHTAKLLSPLL